MDNAALYSALIKFFSEEDISKTREGVFRAAQKSDGTTYSIQYFDSTQPFARDKFDISSYQMDLIGRDYYENPGSLQWNYYLNFLLDEEHLSDSSFSRIKTTIEADRSLARKRIVSLADLNLLLSHQFTPSSLPLPIDVRDIWYERLQELSLEEVLEKEISVDSVIDRYLTEGIEKKTSARNPKLGHVGKMPRLLHLDLQKYRKYPMMRKFRLSRVNLIRGANAVGKTSLMEAIELMVCGKTARNPDLDDAFRFSVRFEGDEKQAVVTKASDKIYRERDASWYGRAYLKGNELPSSFARFNFFDSDAAIRFSEEIENANFFEALKSIVFGTDIQQLERRLNSLGSKLKTTTNDAEVVLQNERAKELAIDTLLINLMASDSGTIAKDALMHRLLELDILPSLTEKPLSEIAGELASYVLVFDSSDIQSRPGHHTIRDIERTIAQATTVRDDFNKLTEKIASGETRLRQLKLSADITNVGLKSTRRLRQYEEVNGFVLFDSEDRLSALSESLKNLESIGSQWRDRPSAFHVNADNSVDSARSEVAVRRISIAAEVSQLRATKAVLLQTREKASLLISEIHERASELLALDVKMTDCPLCGESHISPSLAERVLSVKTASTVADAQIDELAEKELKAESELRVLVDVYEWIQDLQRWSEILNIEWQSTGIIAIGEKIRAALEKKSELDGDINSLQRLLDSLLKRGFSRSDLLATYKESGLPDIGPGNLSLALANRLGVLEKQFDQ